MTIQEIAKMAQVSVSTVSKVMNGKAKDISEPTKQKVLKVIEENNYIPYEKYRVKDGIVNRLMGLILQKVNPEKTRIIIEAERLFKEQGYRLIVTIIDGEGELKKR